jgi:hypothetical protein
MKLVAEKRNQADCIYGAYIESGIDRDSHDRLQAAATGAPVLIEGQIQARAVYFGAIAYELFLVSPTLTNLETVLEDAAVDAASLFPYSPDVLRALRLDPSAFDLLQPLKQKWLGRASGRATLQTATFERASPAFWQDLRTEFDRLDGADLQAMLKDDGWWTVCGGPPDPSVRQTLTFAFGRLFRRGLAALGF